MVGQCTRSVGVVGQCTRSVGVVGLCICPLCCGGTRPTSALRLWRAAAGPLPVRMRRGQHELEVDGTRPVVQLVVLEAVELVGDVTPPHVHLEEREAAG